MTFMTSIMKSRISRIKIIVLVVLSSLILVIGVLLPFVMIGLRAICLPISICVLLYQRLHRPREIITSIEDTGAGLDFKMYDCFFIKRHDFIPYGGMRAYFRGIDKKLIIIENERASRFSPMYVLLNTHDIDMLWLSETLYSHGVNLGK